MNKNRESSEGEDLIAEFLYIEDIKFKREKEINGLKGDSSPYRVADFYLPQYKVYIEFFGQWNVEKHRSRYIEKKRVYMQNNIPCIYLYPDNLGILSFILKRRLKKELKKYKKLRWPLFKLNWSIFTEKAGIGIIILGVLIYYINNLTARIILGLFFISIIYNSLKESFLK